MKKGNFIHGMANLEWNGAVWDELVEMALFHWNPRQNNTVDEMSPFHPPAFMPAGHKNSRPFIEQVLGLK